MHLGNERYCTSQFTRIQSFTKKVSANEVMAGIWIERKRERSKAVVRQNPTLPSRQKDEIKLLRYYNSLPRKPCQIWDMQVFMTFCFTMPFLVGLVCSWAYAQSVCERKRERGAYTLHAMYITLIFFRPTACRTRARQIISLLSRKDLINAGSDSLQRSSRQKKGILSRRKCVRIRLGIHCSKSKLYTVDYFFSSVSQIFCHTVVQCCGRRYESTCSDLPKFDAWQSCERLVK